MRICCLRWTEARADTSLRDRQTPYHWQLMNKWWSEYARQWRGPYTKSRAPCGTQSPAKVECFLVWKMGSNIKSIHITIWEEQHSMTSPFYYLHKRLRWAEVRHQYKHIFMVKKKIVYILEEMVTKSWTFTKSFYGYIRMKATTED